MRCSVCNRILNDFESTLRHSDTKEFLDTCMKCLDGLDIPMQGRSDLSPYDTLEEEYEE
jgi:hypothetical protein